MTTENITTHQIAEAIKKIVDAEINKQWGTGAKLNELLLEFSPEAMHYWIGMVNGFMDVTLEIATGLCIMKGRQRVSEDDIAKSTVISKKGINNILSEIERE